MKCKKLVSLFLSLLLATALAVPACAAFEDVLPTALPTVRATAHCFFRERPCGAVPR